MRPVPAGEGMNRAVALRLMETAGFARVNFSNFTGGVAALHAGRVL